MLPPWIILFTTLYTTAQNTEKSCAFRNKENQFVSQSYQDRRNRAVSFDTDNSQPTKLDAKCHRYNEYFLSENDLQKHLRAECYSKQIRKQIFESTKHIENSKYRLAIQDILWRSKILFDPTPSIVNIPPQSAIKTGDYPPVYSKQYAASNKDQEIKFQETQKLLERDHIEEPTSPWSSPIVLVKKKDKTMRFCIDYRRLNAITIKDASPLLRIDEIFDQLEDASYYTKFDFKSGYFQIPLKRGPSENRIFDSRQSLSIYRTITRDNKRTRYFSTRN